MEDIGYIYLIQSQVNDSLYFGSTNNIKDRLIRHNAGRSLSTRNRRPWVLIRSIKLPTICKARSVEQQMKSHKTVVTQEWFDKCIEEYISD